jgi:hypothetical protein
VSQAAGDVAAATESPTKARPHQASARTPSRYAGAFTPLKWTSFCHSCVYLSLLICAFALGKPQPETFILGWTHGLLWIGMSLACITAARMRIVSLRLAVAVAVLGGIGPFFGSWEFVRAQRAQTKATRQAEKRRHSP